MKGNRLFRTEKAGAIIICNLRYQLYNHIRILGFASGRVNIKNVDSVFLNANNRKM